MMNTQLKKGVVELCVLDALEKQDHYGYELVSAISKAVDITEGTIYPLLRRLKTEGMLSTYLQESRGGPPRKYYRITAQGKKAHKSKRKEWESFTKGVERFLTRKG